MADALFPVLARFHREVVLPDIERIVGDAFGGSERSLRDEMHTLFDALAQRMAGLEAGHSTVRAGVQRIEERLDRIEGRLDAVEGGLRRVEQKVDKMALRSDGPNCST